MSTRPELSTCRALGYEAVDGKGGRLIEYVNGATSGEGMDVVFECSGAVGAAGQSHFKSGLGA